MAADAAAPGHTGPVQDEIKAPSEEDWARVQGMVRKAADLPDDKLTEVVALLGANGLGAMTPAIEMVVQRRLRDAVEALTTETVKARESSERLTGQLDSSIVSLTTETVKARKSSERVGHWLIVLTVALVLLTGALVALPFVQAATSPAPAPSPSARLAPQSHSGPAARAPSPAASSDGGTGLRP